jgi:CheY-specific phosphatase CheX
MNNETQENLFEVLEHVLEQFAFAFCEIVDKDKVSDIPQEMIHSSLSFKGPYSGEIALVLSLDLCIELAGNVLGMDPGDEGVEDYGQDSLKELLNVLIGNLLTELYGEDAFFDFATPHNKCLDKDAWDALVADPSSLTMTIEDAPALLYFKIDK